MSSPEVIFSQSDNIVEVSGVLNVATDAYINDAVVTLTLVDTISEDEVSGQTWPLTLSYVSGSDGDYRGTISNDADIANMQDLTAQITVDGGAGLTRYWEIKCLGLVGS